MSATDGGATVQDVRYELGDTAGEIDQALIEYHLAKAQRSVTESAPGGASAGAVADAIAVVAAYEVATSDRDAFVTAIVEEGDRSDWNVEQFIDRLEDKRDDALDELDGSSGPKLRSLGGRSGRR